jgi:hypothetical protein
MSEHRVLQAALPSPWPDRRARELRAAAVSSDAGPAPIDGSALSK